MEFNLDSLVVFKLMNGEVVICEIVDENEQQVTIRYAIQALESIGVEDGIPIVHFTQWIPFTDDLIVLYRHGILAAAIPGDTIKEMYLNKMAELEMAEEEPTEEVEECPPIMRHQCRNSSFSTRK